MRTLAVLLAVLFSQAALAEEARVAVKGCGAPPSGSSGPPAATYVAPNGCGQVPTQEIAPGAEVSWPAGRVPAFAAALGGPLDVTLADGSKLRIQNGTVILDASRWRKVRNPGKVPVRLMLSSTPYVDVLPTPPKRH